MGYTKIKTFVSNPLNRTRREQIELLVDTGAIYSIIPEATLTQLGIEVSGKRKFRLASGELKEYSTGEAFIEIEKLGATSIVVFGPKDSIPLLGVTTLENLGLQVDPVSGQLKPLELLLLGLETIEDTLLY